MENNKFPREISLCLSGGAARGAFHLGAISVLEEHGIAIKAVSGTSIGALIGGALACGKTSQEIFEIFKSQEFRDIFSFAFSKNYLFNLDVDAEIIDKLIDKKSFEDLDIPLSVSVCDMRSETVKHFSSGNNLKKLILASCSIVPIFKAVELDDMLLVDGGLIDNFPVEQLQQQAYPILGINLYPKYSLSANSIFAWIKKVIYVSWQSHSFEKKNLCDIYLCTPNIQKLRAFSFKDLDKAYALGEEEMRKLL